MSWQSLATEYLIVPGLVDCPSRPRVVEKHRRALWEQSMASSSVVGHMYVRRGTEPYYRVRIQSGPQPDSSVQGTHGAMPGAWFGFFEAVNRRYYSSVCR